MPDRPDGEPKLFSAGEAALSVQQQADDYLALVEQARREMFGPRRQEWLDRLEQEHANLRAVLGWLVERAEAEYGLRLAIGLREFWGQGHQDEGRTWFATFLAFPHVAAWPTLRAQALDDMAILLHDQGEGIAARPLFEESLAVRRALGDKGRIATSLIHLGHVKLYYDGDCVSARAMYEECLALNEEVGNAVGSAYARLALGQLARHEGDYATAGILLRQSLATLHNANAVWAINFALNAFAHLAVCQNQPERALRLAGAREMVCEVIGVHEASFWHERDQRLLEPAQQALDAQACAAAWAAGRGMTLEQAVTYAVEEASKV